MDEIRIQIRNFHIFKGIDELGRSVEFVLEVLKKSGNPCGPSGEENPIDPLFGGSRFEEVESSLNIDSDVFGNSLNDRQRGRRINAFYGHTFLQVFGMIAAEIQFPLDGFRVEIASGGNIACE